jgi:membrane associated rhomboid family serine protease
MFLPISTDNPLRTTPYTNWLLIALNVLAFAGQKAFPQFDHFLTLYPSSPHWYSFFTYQFAHANIWHIGGNMLFLYIFGNVVNDKMGHLGYLTFYLAGGVFAGTCYVFTEQHGLPMIGASGAISAVTGAYLVLSPRSHVTIVWIFFFIGKLEIQSMWVVGFFFVQDLILNGGTDGVAHIAHIGGTLFGFCVCLFFLVTHLLPRDQFDVWALMTRWNKRRQYRGLVSKGFDPFNYKPSAGEAHHRANDAVAEQVQDLRQRINAAIGMHENAVAADLYTKMKALDDQQVMSRTAQLDIATQLHHDGRLADAAEAYETLLRAYPKLERIEQIELALGLLYARDLQQYPRARELLSRVVERVHEGRVLDMAREELTLIPAS